MNRSTAADTLATWRHIIDDTEGPTVQRAAVAELVAATAWFAAETERLEDEVRALIVDATAAARMAREHAPHPRPAKAFVNETDAIVDARTRAQCVVLRVDETERRMGLHPAAVRSTYWSVPIERGYVDGILVDQWRHGTPVELDPALPLIRPPATGTLMEPVEIPRRAG